MQVRVLPGSSFCSKFHCINLRLNWKTPSEGTLAHHFLNIRTMGNSRKFPIAQMSCATAFLWSFAQLQVVDFLLHRDILVGPSARAARRACRHECSAANLFSQIVPPLLVVRCHDNVIASLGLTDDTLAERLRRRPAKPMGSPRVGSNPTGVVFEILERGAARAAQDTMHPENMVDVALQFPTEIAKAKQQQQMKGKDGCMQLVCCGLVA